MLLAATGVGVFLYLHHRSDNTPPPSQAWNETPPPPPKDKTDKEQKPPVVKREPDKTAPRPPRLRVAETEAAVLARINGFRREAGLLPVTLDAELSRSCRAQAKAGAADSGGLLLHGNPLTTVDGALASCFRRPLFLAPDLERIGVGWADRPDGKRQSVLQFARVSRRRETPALLPVPGQTDVPLAFPGNEVPDPIPEAKGQPAGFPITATFPPRTRIRQATGRLTDADGKEVAAWFSSPEKPANPDFRRDQGTSLCLIAREVLRPNTTYTVTMAARVDDKDWSRTWRFTTTTLERQTAGMTGRVLQRINAVRRTAGLEPLTLDEKLSKGCQAHALYLARNAERPELADVLNANDEDPKLPGYTAEGKRIASKAQVFLAPADPEAMVEGWLASFQGRLILLDFEARDLGFGCARGPSKWNAVLLPKFEQGIKRREPLLYPAEGQKGVPTHYDSAESPDLIPESKDRLAGFPITAMFPDGVPVTDVKAELSQNGTAVPFWLLTPEKPVAPDFQPNTICLIARQPLRPDTSYRVHIQAKVMRKPWERTWTFRTASDGPAEQREMVLATLARINAHRRVAGLAPVVLDGSLSAGCLAHARYLLLNSSHPSTRGLGMHDEDPKLPAYTPEGKRAGKDSAVASGMPPPAAVDELLATFYHRMPFLEPRLGRIGVGFSRGGLQGWFTVIDLSGGVGREPVLLFPGDGQQGVPTSWQPDAADHAALPQDAGQQVGYPITLMFPAGKTVRQVEASLTAAGKEVAVWLVPRLSQPWHTACVVPRQPLPVDAVCTVRVTANIDGKAWAQTWSFTTAAAR
jgi:uncharacterized protein YkwD